jgi:hypothetical protein
MYGLSNNGTSRLPRVEARVPSSSSVTPTLGKAIGGALIQAAAIVIVAKLVDVAIESFVNRRRQQQAQAPQRNRREEPVGV